VTELERLAATLADWLGDTSFVIYLFGSRVRGDHRFDSDVDVVIPAPNIPTDADMDWWLAQNNEEFATINSRLPGSLHILPNNDPVADLVLQAAANPILKDRNVLCVRLKSKTRD